MYQIKVTPANKRFAPHIWKEGGVIPTNESADHYAHQLRIMKAIDGKGKMYDKVEVVKVILMFVRVTAEGFELVIWYKDMNGAKGFTKEITPPTPEIMAGILSNPYNEYTMHVSPN